MLFKTVLKKTSALFGAMLIMAGVWCFLHLPGVGLQMVVFAFLSSAALCCTADSKVRIGLCCRMVCGAAAAQFLIGITADYPLIRIIAFSLFSFLTLSKMPDRQCAVIVLIVGCLTLFAPAGLSASLNRCVDLAAAGAAVLLITAVSNAVDPDFSETPWSEQFYTFRQAAVMTAELSAGFIIFQMFNHEQAAWIMLTILFVHMAENPQISLSTLAEQRITAAPLGILAAGMYLCCFGSVNYQMIYIVPFSGTLCFFMFYLKGNYFIFTFLFMFTMTVFTDWMLGTGNRFHFADIMLTRCAATGIGILLLLGGKNLMQKECVV